MSLPVLTLALASLLPVMLGPAPAPRDGPATITATMCGGGTVTIPLGPGKAPAERRDCHPKGCHAGTCREDKSIKLISRKDA
ncbi:hypothetical protein [Erythrobacter sp. WG]|uniref:hypothetical protein n=1 Tax=Erythrobacter sp. WG TaxID=2985510 RepID=UPI00226F7C9F|nr:hypothetical protein [Erythrobacter sp. WG]MCX9147786.1 hypothetical protein [Erythrobacter sp. WG]